MSQPTEASVVLVCSFIVGENSVTGGHGTLIREMASCLKADGVDVRVVALYGNISRDLRGSAVTLHKWAHNPGWGSLKKALFWLYSILLLARHVRDAGYLETKPTFISFTAGASFLLPIMGMTCIIWENVAFFKKRHLVDLLRLKIIEICNAVVVVPTEEEKVRINARLPKLNCRFIRNWHSPAVLTKNSQIDGPKKFMLAGMLQRRKGFDLFIEGLSHVASRIDPGTEFHIYGVGSELERLELQVGRLGLQNMVFFKGFCEDIYSIYRNYDAFILSSRLEGFPLVMVDALAAGLPVIAFDCPTGPSAIVRTGFNGILVEQENVTELGAAIESFGAEENLYRRYRENCKASVEPYNLKVVMEDWKALIGRFPSSVDTVEDPRDLIGDR